MNLKKYFLFPILFVISISHLSCKKSQSSKTTIFESSSRKQAVIDPTLIDGSKLVIKELSARNQKVGEHRAIRIEVVPDENADYTEFFMCSNTTPQVCKPSPDKPEKMLENTVLYPDPPVGLLTIVARACIYPKNAKDLTQLCGVAKEITFNQIFTDCDEACQALKNQRAQQNTLVLICEKIEEDMLTYKESMAVENSTARDAGVGLTETTAPISMPIATSSTTLPSVLVGTSPDEAHTKVDPRLIESYVSSHIDINLDTLTPLLCAKALQLPKEKSQLLVGTIIGISIALILAGGFIMYKARGKTKALEVVTADKYGFVAGVMPTESNPHQDELMRLKAGKKPIDDEIARLTREIARLQAELNGLPTSGAGTGEDIDKRRKALEAKIKEATDNLAKWKKKLGDLNTDLANLKTNIQDTSDEINRKKQEISTNKTQKAALESERGKILAQLAEMSGSDPDGSLRAELAAKQALLDGGPDKLLTAIKTVFNPLKKSSDYLKIYIDYYMEFSEGRRLNITNDELIKKAETKRNNLLKGEWRKNKTLDQEIGNLTRFIEGTKQIEFKNNEGRAFELMGGYRGIFTAIFKEEAARIRQKTGYGSTNYISKEASAIRAVQNTYLTGARDNFFYYFVRTYYKELTNDIRELNLKIAQDPNAEHRASLGEKLKEVSKKLSINELEHNRLLTEKSELENKLSQIREAITGKQAEIEALTRKIAEAERQLPIDQKEKSELDTASKSADIAANARKRAQLTEKLGLLNKNLIAENQKLKNLEDSIVLKETENIRYLADLKQRQTAFAEAEEARRLEIEGKNTEAELKTKPQNEKISGGDGGDGGGKGGGGNGDGGGDDDGVPKEESHETKKAMMGVGFLIFLSGVTMLAAQLSDNLYLADTQTTPLMTLINNLKVRAQEADLVLENLEQLRIDLYGRIEYLP